MTAPKEPPLGVRIVLWGCVLVICLAVALSFVGMAVNIWRHGAPI